MRCRALTKIGGKCLRDAKHPTGLCTQHESLRKAGRKVHFADEPSKWKLAQLTEQSARLSDFPMPRTMSEQVAKAMEKAAKAVEQQFTSPTYEQVAKAMEDTAKAVEQRFTSPMYEQMVKAMEETAKAVEQQLTSPMYEQMVKAMEETAKAVERLSSFSDLDRILRAQSLVALCEIPPDQVEQQTSLVRMLFACWIVPILVVFSVSGGMSSQSVNEAFSHLLKVFFEYWLGDVVRKALSTSKQKDD